MSAAANAAAFLSMRRRLPEDAGPKHFAPSPAVTVTPPRPVRVAAVDPAVQVSYRKRRWVPG